MKKWNVYCLWFLTQSPGTNTNKVVNEQTVGFDFDLSMRKVVSFIDEEDAFYLGARLLCCTVPGTVL